VDYSEDRDHFGFNFVLALPTEEQASSCSKTAGDCSCAKLS
jgi:hypothetical protein